jgi:uroporphyrin-3 C-methyltransferase
VNNENPRNEDSQAGELEPSIEEEMPSAEPDAAEEEPLEPEVKPIPSELPSAPPPRRGSFLSFLALLIALAALSGTTWMWWQDATGRGQEEERVLAEVARLDSSDSELSLKIRQVRDELEALPVGEVGPRVEALERRLESDLTEVERLEKTVNEQLAISRSLQMAGAVMQDRLSAAETALSGLATRDLDAGGELDLSEVDYLLRLANERLKLFYDPVAADATLELADMHLAALDDPIYLSVRQDIAAARRELAALELPDFFAISNELDSIQESVAGLPFKGQEAPAVSPEDPSSEGWWEKLKGVFAGLVTVRRSTDQEDQRISLEDKDYVRQRLWLQLEISHLALMRRDQEAFRHSLSRVQETMDAWFEPSSASFRELSGKIASLGEQEIRVEVPDISKPWSTLRQVRSLRSLPPAAVPAEEPPVEAEAIGDSQG